MALGYPHPRVMLRELTSQDVTEWMAFYRVRPFGYAWEAKAFGTLAAQQFNLHKTRGRDKSWDDIYPVTVRKDADGRDDPRRIIELFQQYNLERGYSADGKKKLH